MINNSFIVKRAVVIKWRYKLNAYCSVHIQNGIMLWAININPMIFRFRISLNSDNRDLNLKINSLDAKYKIIPITFDITMIITELDIIKQMMSKIILITNSLKIVLWRERLLYLVNISGIFSGFSSASFIGNTTLKNLQKNNDSKGIITRINSWNSNAKLE